MTEEIKNQHKEHEHATTTHEHHEHSHEHHEHDEHHEEKQEKKEEQKKESKKESLKQTKEKKEEAVVRGLSLHVSKKQCMYICRFIKNKSIDKAMLDLEQVIKLKRAIPFKGEIPHRKGMMSGRYPVKASKLFINLLKGLKGNISVNNLDLDKTVIYFASANWASRPLRREGRKAKRTSVTLKAREIQGGNN